MGEIINNNNILKTWNRNFERPTGCVSVHSFSFHTFPLTPDTDYSTFSMGRAVHIKVS